MTGDKNQYIHQWLSKANEDLLVVHQLINADSIALGVIGFHCQQAAEKFLKAFLIYHDIEPPRTHNLEFLLELCAEIEKKFSEVDSLNLTDYGVQARYPGDYLVPCRNELNEFIRIVEHIRELVNQKID
ncbi:MAG: HEPN domain-containing protein [Alphaproteobacteria bacterium]|nr:HEPN domain-containing protein [Alphaproteobacteria bacterium]